MVDDELHALEVAAFDSLDAIRDRQRKIASALERFLGELPANFRDETEADRAS